MELYHNFLLRKILKYQEILEYQPFLHCVKSVRIRSFSTSHFPAFGINMDQKNSEYGHFSRSVTLNSLFLSDYFFEVSCLVFFKQFKYVSFDFCKSRKHNNFHNFHACWNERNCQISCRAWFWCVLYVIKISTYCFSLEYLGSKFPDNELVELD